MADTKTLDTPPAAAPMAQSSAALAMNELDRQYVDRVMAMRAKTAAEGAALLKATAEGRTHVTDFAGTVNGPFGVYGVNLDKGGQLTVNGQVPEIQLTRPGVIKGVLVAPGMSLQPGPVTVKLGSVEFKGWL